MKDTDDRDDLRTHISKVSLKAVLKRLPPGWAHGVRPQPSVMTRGAKQAEEFE